MYIYLIYVYIVLLRCDLRQEDMYITVRFWHLIFENIPDIFSSPINFSCWCSRCDRHLEYWFQIYRRSFNFLNVTYHRLYLYVWTTSLDHTHVWLPEHANWLYHMYLPGCFLTTLDPHVQILESEPWRPYCSWSECIAEAWISGCLSGPSFFQPPLDRLARFSSNYSWVLSRISYCTFCFCASWWSYILDKLYHALW